MAMAALVGVIKSVLLGEGLLAVFALKAFKSMERTLKLGLMLIFSPAGEAVYADEERASDDDEDDGDASGAGEVSVSLGAEETEAVADEWCTEEGDESKFKMVATSLSSIPVLPFGIPVLLARAAISLPCLLPAKSCTGRDVLSRMSGDSWLLLGLLLIWLPSGVLLLLILTLLKLSTPLGSQDLRCEEGRLQGVLPSPARSFLALLPNLACLCPLPTVGKAGKSFPSTRQLDLLVLRP